MADRGIHEQLVKHLTDVHSIEEQALTQLRRAPSLAVDEDLADAYRAHLAETEGQERRISDLLAGRDANPSRVKDLAGRAGGIAMLAFARGQPDTPGKLTAHAYSYEHMELAAYELLRRIARRAGDEEVERVAAQIADEERRMAARLEGLFDAAVDASLVEVGAGDIGDHLDDYLADAHAIEQQALQLLETGPELVELAELAELLRAHLEETRGHERLIEERLESRGAKPSRAKDALLRLGGVGIGGFFGGQPDTTSKLAGFAFAFEHIEIGSYELLRRVAERAGDEATVAVAEAILAEERATAEGIAALWDAAAQAGLEEQDVAR